MTVSQCFCDYMPDMIGDITAGVLCLDRRPHHYLVAGLPIEWSGAGGRIAYTYTPHFPEGYDGSTPEDWPMSVFELTGNYPTQGPKLINVDGVYQLSCWLEVRPVTSIGVAPTVVRAWAAIDVDGLTVVKNDRFTSSFPTLHTGTPPTDEGVDVSASTTMIIRAGQTVEPIFGMSAQADAGFWTPTGTAWMAITRLGGV